MIINVLVRIWQKRKKKTPPPIITSDSATVRELNSVSKARDQADPSAKRKPIQVGSIKPIP